MKQNNYLVKLIEKATQKTGSITELAKALDVPQPNVSAWKAGTRTCTPADRARLADLAQEDAVQELVRATMEATAGTTRGEQLKAVLGKWLHQTGAATGSKVAGIFGLIFGTAWSGASVDVLRCIKSETKPT